MGHIRTVAHRSEVFRSCIPKVCRCAVTTCRGVQRGAVPSKELRKTSCPHTGTCQAALPVTALRETGGPLPDTAGHHSASSHRPPAQHPGTAVPSTLLHHRGNPGRRSRHAGPKPLEEGASHCRALAAPQQPPHTEVCRTRSRGPRPPSRGSRQLHHWGVRASVGQHRAWLWVTALTELAHAPG